MTGDLVSARTSPESAAPAVPAAGGPESGIPAGGRAAVWHWLTTNPVGANPEGRRLGARRWRRSSGVFLIYLAYSVPDLWSSAGPMKLAGGLLLLAVFVFLYLGPLPVAMFRGPWRYQLLVLAGMPTIMIVYLLVFGRGGLLLATYLSVAIALLSTPIIGIPVIGAIAAAVTWGPEHVESWHIHGPQWSLSGPPVLIAIALFAIRSNVTQRIELFAARAEVERLAKEQERLRIARDLHDLLGHALTSITMKAELASRLVDRDPARAADEMRQVAELGRHSLSDVRATVAGYREVSLVTELAAARQVLSAAGIQAELPASVEEVPVGLRELFGWALREGVTNAVRHSRARHLRVTVAANAIEIVDDGIGAGGNGASGNGASVQDSAGGTWSLVVGNDSGQETRGNGLAGLAERAAAAGGRVQTGSAVTVGPRRDGGARLGTGSAPGRGFRLRVEVAP
jgi:two-component system, NarL family, sensor histidine kinase DesK